MTNRNMLPRMICPLRGDGLHERHRPRIHEHDLDIEQDEEHRHEVELHAEARLRADLRNHAALVGRVFVLLRRPRRPSRRLSASVTVGEPHRHEDVQQKRARNPESWPALYQNPGRRRKRRWGYFAAVAAAQWRRRERFESDARPLYFLPVFLTMRARRGSAASRRRAGEAFPRRRWPRSSPSGAHEPRRRVV